jgi:hypothetical protein
MGLFDVAAVTILQSISQHCLLCTPTVSADIIIITSVFVCLKFLPCAQIQPSVLVLP